MHVVQVVVRSPRCLCFRCSVPVALLVLFSLFPLPCFSRLGWVASLRCRLGCRLASRWGSPPILLRTTVSRTLGRLMAAPCKLLRLLASSSRSVSETDTVHVLSPGLPSDRAPRRLWKVLLASKLLDCRTAGEPLSVVRALVCILSCLEDLVVSVSRLLQLQVRSFPRNF